MKSKAILLGILLLSSVSLFAQTEQKDYTQYVSPLMGTKGIFHFGRTVPFVTPPFGMTDWTACNFTPRICLPLYNYMWHKIVGFRGTHKPAMCMGDYGYVSLMPAVGNKALKTTAHSAAFSHRHEKSTPYYYSVRLNRSKKKRMNVEIAASEHCGVFRIQFPKTAGHHLFVEASREMGGWIKVDTAKRQVIGWNTDIQSQSISPPLPHFKGYFVMQFNADIKDFGTWLRDSIFDHKDAQAGVLCGARVSFTVDTLLVKIGTSFISLEQAQQNLDQEIQGWDLAPVQERTEQAWNKYLSRFQIEGATHNQQMVFYSSIYHALLFPRQFSEHGRYYSAFDDTIHQGVSYNDYSLWDTYRAEHPMLLFLTPELVPGMVQSLLQMYQEGGYMPKWPNPSYTGIMIGTHADAVVADAVVKGVKGFDLQLAYKACMKDAMVPPDNDSIRWWGDRDAWTSYEARSGLSWYKKLGYVPVDKTAESVSNTLEGAYNDFCVAQVAKAVGDTANYHLLMDRSQYYHNVYNPQTGMMAPKLSNGQWSRDMNAGFTEGSPWTYLFSAPQDVPGLIKLMGGNKPFIKKLDENFWGGHYVHENEPGHNYCYLYDYAQAAWKTQKRVAHYRTIKYHNRPQGMTGDDDCGQMSAWYIFGAFGFYPVTPGTDEYALGTPLFPKSSIYFDPANPNKKIEIVAEHVSKRNIYVQSVSLNGVELNQPFIHHADLVNGNGGKLVFKMGPKPRKDW